jgi:AcrR family transcriptional regulator
MEQLTSAPSDRAGLGDRRARRRQETIDEILAISIEIMTRDGVNGLSLAEVARRLGVQPPSLYKYFPSLKAVFDALFFKGATEHLAVLRAAMTEADPGLPALTEGLEASGRWGLANPALAQLLFWRPVPNFEPSAASLAPSVEMVELQRDALKTAADLRQLGAGARESDAVYLFSVLIAGVLTQALANEPSLPWGQGRFTPVFRTLMSVLAAAFPLHPEGSTPP